MLGYEDETFKESCVCIWQSMHHEGGNVSAIRHTWLDRLWVILICVLQQGWMDWGSCMVSTRKWSSGYWNARRIKTELPTKKQIVTYKNIEWWKGGTGYTCHYVKPIRGSLPKWNSNICPMIHWFKQYGIFMKPATRLQSLGKIKTA